MKDLPETVAEFLRGSRFAVAGVSRQAAQPANAIFRKLVASGRETYPVNPNATEVEGVKCYPDVRSLPGPVHGVVIATHPDVAIDVVSQCAEARVGHVWMHRSFGQGSVSAEAVRACERAGIVCIEGGCPLMYCDPVDIGHRCMRWWLRRRGRVPG